MRIYVFYHDHRHGHDAHLVRPESEPSIEQAIEACDIDFEADREDEYLELAYSVTLEEIAEV